MSDRLNAIENQIDDHLEQVDRDEADHEAAIEWFGEDAEPDESRTLLLEFLDSRNQQDEFYSWLAEIGPQRGLFNVAEDGWEARDVD